jgi:hypothetical protein
MVCIVVHAEPAVKKPALVLPPRVGMPGMFMAS